MTMTENHHSRRTVTISERALVQRINRKLAPDFEQLRVARIDSRVEFDFGRYYLINQSLNFVIAKNCDLETLGRELGVLTAFESLEDEA